MDNKLTFHINNMAYTISVNDELKEELLRFLPNIENNMDTRELLAAYIRVSQELTRFKQGVKNVSDKIPDL